MSYRARGGSGYRGKSRSASVGFGKKYKGKKSDDTFGGISLSDKSALKQISGKIRSVLLEKTDNVFNQNTYPYLKKSVVSMTPLEKVQTALFNGSEEHFMVLSAKKAKEVLDCDIGFEALEQKKRNVALVEDGGLYQWYGFNKDNDWEPLTDLFNIGEQISVQDAEYLLKHGKLVYK